MENATDALKTAFAVMVFVLALSVSILALTRAKQAATSILSQSTTQFYDTEDIEITDERIVGTETIIPTLYSYYKEGYTILFYNGELEDPSNMYSPLRGEITPVTLYYSEALEQNLYKSKLVNKKDSYGKGSVPIKDVGNKDYWRAIYGFDVDDESTREEPWNHDDFHNKEFIKSFINNISSPEYDFSRKSFTDTGPNKVDHKKLQMNFVYTGDSYGFGHGFTTSLAKADRARFIERIGIYNMTASVEQGSTPEDRKVNTTLDDSVIEFSNGETIENEEGTQKRVIQYIYIGNF